MIRQNRDTNKKKNEMEMGVTAHLRDCPISEDVRRNIDNFQQDMRKVTVDIRNQTLAEMVAVGNPYAQKYIAQNYFQILPSQLTADKIEKVGANFMVRDGKVFYKDQEEPVCNFTVEIVTYTIVNMDGRASEKVYDIEVCTRSKREQVQDVTTNNLRNCNFYRNLPQFKDLIIRQGELFVQYIDTLMENFSGEDRMVERFSGWHKIDGRYQYLTNDGAIGNLSVAVTSYVPLHLGKIRNLSVKERFANIRSMMEVAGEISKMLVLYLLVSLLYTFFAEAGFAPKFILFVVGQRNTRKTSLALNLTRMLNREKGTQKPDCIFLSTQAGIEREVKKYHDAVLLVDDLMPSGDTTTRKRREGNLEYIVRLFGDSTKKRRNTDFTSREIAERTNYEIKGGCVATGEYYQGVQSSITRMCVVEMTEGCVDLDRLTFLQENPNILLDFVTDFIEYATVYQEDIIQNISRSVQVYRRSVAGCYSASRYEEQFAVFNTISDIFCNYIVVNGLAESVAAEEIRNDLKAVIAYYIQRNSEMLEEQSEESIICRALQDLYERYQDRPSMDGVEENEKYLFVTADLLVQTVEDWRKDRGMSGPEMSKARILKICAEQNWIYVSTEGDKIRSTHKLSDKTKNSRRYIYFIKRNVL